MNNTLSSGKNVCITTGAINKNNLTSIVNEHGYAIVCHVDIERSHWDIAYTVGLSKIRLPELYIRLPAASPLSGAEIDLIHTIVDHHHSTEMTIGDLITVPDTQHETTHEFGIVPVTFSYPLPGVAAVFPSGPSWTVEVATGDCRCGYCHRHLQTG